MPPPSRNHLLPTLNDTPTPTAAASVLSPLATPRQNSRSTRRGTLGLPRPAVTTPQSDQGVATTPVNPSMILQDILNSSSRLLASGRGGFEMPALLPCLIRSRGARLSRWSVSGLPLVDDYLEFLAGRARPNKVLAAGYDLKVFFTVVAKAPEDVRPADVPRPSAWHCGTPPARSGARRHPPPSCAWRPRGRSSPRPCTGSRAGRAAGAARPRGSGARSPAPRPPGQPRHERPAVPAAAGDHQAQLSHLPQRLPHGHPAHGQQLREHMFRRRRSPGEEAPT